MPVDREGCTTKSPDTLASPETFKFTWNVALSFPSPGHHFLAERLAKGRGYDLYGPISTQYQLARAQSVAQHIRSSISHEGCQGKLTKP